ncbi:MAG: HesA/MoeB/ThiF family protein, partial [Muribaculaceae bacterium]|nr:HesA/MoeB/ThiF family protein [Muribaculaceae bacterium]
MEKFNALDKQQRIRYSRTLLIPDFNEENQLRLLNSNVLIVGAGALGSIVSMYLAASGIGNITVADFDDIDLSNLQRQLSFTTADIGHSKAEITATKLLEINPEINVSPMVKLINRDDCKNIFPDYDLIIEGSDNPSTKYMVADACVKLGKKYVLGGISTTNGQLMSYMPGCASYRDWFPEQGCGNGFTPCSVGGVLGPVPGVIGSLMATEAIKILADIGSPLFN